LLVNSDNALWRLAMRNHLILAAAAALTLSATAAMAQNTQSSPPATMPAPPTAPSAANHQPAANPLTQTEISKIEGTKVYGSDNKNIGHISQVLMDPQTKKIDRLVVAVGGVLGIGGHQVALPVNQFSWDSTAGAFKIAENSADLKSMPEWRSSESAAGASQGSDQTNPPQRVGG
jgi:sporulation protein YlmC with PRC-barrel domain